MKYHKTIILFLIIQIFIPGMLLGQKHQIGIELGYGNTNSINDNNLTSTKHYKDFSNYLRIGVQYYYNINKYDFNLLAGINYDNNWENTSNLTYIRIPLGIEFYTGRKIKFVIGFGFFISGLAFYKGISESSDFEETLKRIQLGGFGNLRFEYQLSTRYSIGLGLQVNRDFTKLYDEWSVSSGGSRFIIREGRGLDSFIKLNLKYKF